MLNLCSVKQRRERNTLQCKKHEDQLNLATDYQTKLPPHTQTTKDRSQSPHIDQVFEYLPKQCLCLIGLFSAMYVVTKVSHECSFYFHFIYLFNVFIVSNIKLGENGRCHTVLNVTFHSYILLSLLSVTVVFCSGRTLIAVVL